MSAPAPWLNFFILVPIYIYPNPPAWQSLYDGIANYTGLNFKVIINPSSGPGSTSYPDTNWQTAISYINSFPNVETLGFVNCNSADRQISDVEAEIDTYNNWASLAGTDIHMDGIWFDRSPVDYDNIPWMTTLTDYAVSTMVRGNNSLINPGVNPNESYYSIPSVNYINAYTAPYAVDALNYEAAIDVIPYELQYRSTAMIYNYRTGLDYIDSQMNYFMNNNFGGLWVTTDYSDDFDEWSGNWADFLESAWEWYNSTYYPPYSGPYY